MPQFAALEAVSEAFVCLQEACLRAMRNDDSDELAAALAQFGEREGVTEGAPEAMQTSLFSASQVRQLLRASYTLEARPANQKNRLLIVAEALRRNSDLSAQACLDDDLNALAENYGDTRLIQFCNGNVSALSASLPELALAFPSAQAYRDDAAQCVSKLLEQMTFMHLQTLDLSGLACLAPEQVSDFVQRISPALKRRVVRLDCTGLRFTQALTLGMLAGFSQLRVLILQSARFDQPQALANLFDSLPQEAQSALDELRLIEPLLESARGDASVLPGVSLAPFLKLTKLSLRAPSYDAKNRQMHDTELTVAARLLSTLPNPHLLEVLDLQSFRFAERAEDDAYSLDSVLSSMCGLHALSLSASICCPFGLMSSRVWIEEFASSELCRVLRLLAKLSTLDSLDLSGIRVLRKPALEGDIVSSALSVYPSLVKAIETVFAASRLKPLLDGREASLACTPTRPVAMSS
ncbi:MAG: hypothetical protein V4623_04680 [Pseudomonadota bacterium]